MLRGLVLLAAVSAFLPSVAEAETMPPNFVEKVANVNRVKINYKIGGKRPVAVLLHGYPQTSHTWLPIIPAFGASHSTRADASRPPCRPHNHQLWQGWRAADRRSIRRLIIHSKSAVARV